MGISNNNNFKILALDGGGVRGIFSAHLLRLISEKLGLDVYSAFDLIVGTSSGSIVAAAISIHYDLTELVNGFEQHAPNIFKQSTLLQKFVSKFRMGWVKSRYESKTLERFLYEEFGDIELGQIEQPLIINATNISSGGVYVFKTVYQKDRQGVNGYRRDGDTPLFKAVLASCSAPTYFDPVKISENLICDGGIWANNPGLVGYVDAIRNFGVQHDRIKIFSVGTGKVNKFYDSSAFWGFATGWGRQAMVDFFMLNQNQHVENCLNLILSDNFLRIDPNIDSSRLDDCQIIPILKHEATNQFFRAEQSIRDFFHSG